MKYYPIHIDSDGEFELPPELLEEAGLKEGDVLEVTVAGAGVLRLTKAEIKDPAVDSSSVSTNRPTYDDVAQFIDTQTSFKDGIEAAGLLVNMVASDILRARTTTTNGRVETSEGRAFDTLVSYLDGDLTAVYRVLAMLAASSDELATALGLPGQLIKNQPKGDPRVN